MPQATIRFSSLADLTPEAMIERCHTVRSGIARQAMTVRVEAGECPGIAPIGYVNTVVGTRRTVAIDPGIGPLIVEAFRMAARQHSSLRKVLTELTPRGLVGRGGRAMSVSTLQNILRNPFYAGYVRLGDRLYPGSHRPLVSRSLFDRVQSRLFRRRCR